MEKCEGIQCYAHLWQLAVKKWSRGNFSALTIALTSLNSQALMAECQRSYSCQTPWKIASQTTWKQYKYVTYKWQAQNSNIFQLFYMRDSGVPRNEVLNTINIAKDWEIEYQRVIVTNYLVKRNSCWHKLIAYICVCVHVYCLYTGITLPWDQQKINTIKLAS